MPRHTLGHSHSPICFYKVELEGPKPPHRDNSRAPTISRRLELRPGALSTCSIVAQIRRDDPVSHATMVPILASKEGVHVTVRSPAWRRVFSRVFRRRLLHISIRMQQDGIVADGQEQEAPTDSTVFFISGTTGVWMDPGWKAWSSP